MSGRRLTTSLLIALAISGLFTYLLGRKMTAHAAGTVAERKLVAPARAIASGEVLKESDLELIAWPASDAISGAFAQPAELVGRTVLYPLEAGQPMTDKVVSAVGAGTGLAARIPDGMRAIALRSDDIVGVAGFLSPGTHLDVLVTYRTDKNPEPTTATILQNAEVLAAGHQVQPDPEGKPATVTVVTLLLSPLDAERVVLASTQGTIHFVLRSGSDTAQTHDEGVSLAQLSPLSSPSVEPRPAAEVRRTETYSAPRPMPARYVVETIQGDKETSNSFSTVNGR